MHRRLFPLLLIAPLLVCCSKSEPKILNPYIVLPPPGMQMAAAYFELSNPGKDTVKIGRIQSPGFDSIEIHQSVIEKGLSRMRPVSALELTPGQSVRFEPGGMHLMLIGYRKEPTEYLNFPISIELVKADGSSLWLEQKFEIRSPAASDLQ